MFNHEVLVKAVNDGVGRLDAPIAYATGKNELGHHTGLIFHALGTIYFDDQSLLVHPDYVSEPDPKPHVISEGGDDDGIKPETTQPSSKTTRYFGRVEIDPQRVSRDIGLIVEEVIERLTGQIGCEVEITLEISAKKPEGFEESMERTISENSRTLKFEVYGFEVG